MNALESGIRRVAAQLDRTAATIRKGIVQSYNPNNYTVRVLIQPENTLTGWISIRALTGGNAWGLVVGFMPGMWVTLEPQEDDPGSYEVSGIIFPAGGGVQPPPVPAGEIWAINEAGNYVKIMAEGIDIAAGETPVSVNGSIVTINATTAVVNATSTTVNGAATVNGNLVVNGGIQQV